MSAGSEPAVCILTREEKWKEQKIGERTGNNSFGKSKARQTYAEVGKANHLSCSCPS